MRGIGRWAALGGLLLGCGSPPAGKTVTVAPSVKPPPPKAWRLARYPAQSSDVVVVERLPDGLERLLVGGLRAERRGSQVTFAADATLHPLRRTCRSDDGFLHYVRGGGLFWSETFLGPLVSSGATTLDLEQALLQCGPVVLAFVDRERVAVISRHGTHLFDRGSPRVESVRFSSLQRGRAIASPDRLLATKDGGRSFVEEAARPAAPLDTPATWLGGDAGDAPPKTLSDEEAEPVLMAWVRRAVQSETGRLVGGFDLGEGTKARVLDAGNRNYVAFRRADGRISSYRRDEFLEFRTWGDKLLEQPRQTLGPLVALGPDGPTPLPEAPLRIRRLVADPTGRFIAALGQADPDAGKPSDSLMRFDGERWQVDEGLDLWPVALENGWLVAATDYGRKAAVYRFSDPKQPALELKDQKARVEERAMALLPPELAFVSYSGPAYEDQTTSQLVWLGLDEPEAKPRVFPLPPKVDQLGFADPQHGVLLRNYWVPAFTSNSGQTFETLPDADIPPSSSDGIRCWSHGCSLVDALAWTDEPFHQERVLGSEVAAKLDEPAGVAAAPDPDADPAAPYRSPMEAPPTTAPLYRCRATPAVAEKHQFLEALLKLVPKSNTLLRATAAVGLLERRGQALVWNGHDAQGDFSVETRTLTGPGLELTDEQVRLLPLGLAMSDTLVAPVMVAREFAVLLAIKDRRMRVFTVRTDGATELLNDVPRGYAESLATPTGTALLVSANGNNELISLAPSGAVLGRRWVVSPPALLAVDAGAPALMLPKKGKRAELLSIVQGSAAREIALPKPDPFPECRGATPADALHWYSGGFDGPRLDVQGLTSSPATYPTHWAEPSTALGLIETTARGSCLRGVVISDPFAAELHPDQNGVMTGTLIGPDRNHALRCTRVKATKKSAE